MTGSQKSSTLKPEVTKMGKKPGVGKDLKLKVLESWVDKEGRVTVKIGKLPKNLRVVNIMNGISLEHIGGVIEISFAVTQE